MANNPGKALKSKDHERGGRFTDTGQCHWVRIMYIKLNYYELLKAAWTGSGKPASGTSSALMSRRPLSA